MKKEIAKNYRIDFKVIHKDLTGFEWETNECYFITHILNETQEQINHNGKSMGIELDTLYGKEFTLDEVIDNAMQDYCNRYCKYSIGYELIKYSEVVA